MLKQYSKVAKCSLIALSLNFLFTGFTLCGEELNKADKPVTTFEMGQKYTEGIVKVIELKGSWHAIGANVVVLCVMS